MNIAGELVSHMTGPIIRTNESPVKDLIANGATEVWRRTGNGLIAAALAKDACTMLDAGETDAAIEMVATIVRGAQQGKLRIDESWVASQQNPFAPPRQETRAAEADRRVRVPSGGMNLKDRVRG